MQAGVAELNLRFGAGEAGDLQIARRVSRVAQNSGLADAGFTDEDQGGAQPIPDGVDERVQGAALVHADAGWGLQPAHEGVADGVVDGVRQGRSGQVACAAPSE
jgi:hypothetical protein